jgi:hypothetical protein
MLFINRLKRNVFYLPLLVMTGLISCGSPAEEQQEEELTVEVQNPLDVQRSDVFVHIPSEDISELNSEYFVVMDGEQEIPSQYNKKGQYPGIVLVLGQMNANEARQLTVRAVSEDSVGDYTKRTQAELSAKEGGEWRDREYIGGTFKNVDSLRVPDEHTDHSWYIRYEGPGWESDKVGYRFYLDWRNATDVFGKTTNEVVLQKVGQDGFDSYHEMQDWGMDVLKVGSSLGIGSPAVFHEGKAVRIDSTDSVISKVLINGDVYSAIQTNYYGWDVANKELDVQSVYAIHADSRLTHHHLQIEGNTDNVATGIGKSDSAKFYSNRGEAGKYGYLATWGRQSLNNDKLGLAVLFSSGKVMELTEDEHSHIVTLQPDNGIVDYYFLATWELEKNGIKTEQEFLDYLDKTARELANPVAVNVVNNN